MACRETYTDQGATKDYTSARLNSKDASASVYGSRGANGVVIVETKRGGN